MDKQLQDQLDQAIADTGRMLSLAISEGWDTAILDRQFRLLLQARGNCQDGGEVVAKQWMKEIAENGLQCALPRQN